MPSKNDIIAEMLELKRRYGDWTYDIPLTDDVWTRGNEKIPHTRLYRIVQIIEDLVGTPFNECRILDLGCLDGLFSIECAKRGAVVLGVEVRTANIAKAKFAKRVLNLQNLDFLQEDVLNLSRDSVGVFDAIICSGILYHLDTPDVFGFVHRLYAMTSRLLIVDTQVALSPKSAVHFCGRQFHGKHWKEHDTGDDDQTRESRLWASYKNERSFVFTRPSLLNLLMIAGFSSSYECFNPPHLNFGQPGIEHRNRCTFVAIKGSRVHLHTSPDANDLSEYWPEGALTYNES